MKFVHLCIFAFSVSCAASTASRCFRWPVLDRLKDFSSLLTKQLQLVNVGALPWSSSTTLLLGLRSEIWVSPCKMIFIFILSLFYFIFYVFYFLKLVFLTHCFFHFKAVPDTLFCFIPVRWSLMLLMLFLYFTLLLHQVLLFLV